MAEPTISVAVPTSGRPRLLRHALASVLAQTRLPDELVVSEDGADPDTEQVMKELESAGVSVRLNRNVPPLGQYGNRRRAFELTTGSYLAMLDDDDAWEPEYLERASAALDAHPECGFVTSDHWTMDADGTILVRETDASSRYFGRASMETGVYSDVLVRHLRQKSFAFGTGLFRREALVGFGYLPEGSGTACDFATFLELGARHISTYYIAERLGRYRVHAGQVTRDRVLPGADAMNWLIKLSRRHELDEREHRALRERFQVYAVEVAVGYAHRGERREALRTLARFGALGPGIPPLRRVVVLALLLLGVKPSWRRGHT